MTKDNIFKPKNSYPNYWGNISEQDYYNQQGIKSTKSFYKTPLTNQTLFTRSWEPLSSPPRGIICMLHGFGNDISWTFQSTPIFLAQNGFSCFALDLIGHGQSNGLKGFVPNIDLAVDTCVEYFNSIMGLPNYEKLPSFLYGESLGGALCLLITMKFSKINVHKSFKGAILIAPMCRISENVKPRWPIPEFLTFVAKFMPKLPIVPTPDILDKSIKVDEKKLIAVMNPMRYKGKPRLGTVLELLRVTDYLSENLKDVTVPFIVLHGTSDVVTEISVSRSLYEEAKSEDKTIKIYDGMYHSLLFGETDDNVALVRNDVLDWLSFRCVED